MDPARLPSQLWQSIRIAYSDEWWLLPGLVVVAIAYPIWVGATGVAVLAIGNFVGLSLSLSPWTGQTTALAGVLAIFWVAGPAAVGTYLIVQRLRNPSDNLRTCYRLEHPLVLFSLPALVLAVGVGLIATGSVAGQALVALGAVYLAIRGAAYAHRVFALSLPLLAEAILFLTLAGGGISLLAAGALGAGRKAVVADSAVGIADVLGVPALAGYADGVVGLGGVELSMIAATVAVPALLPTAAYLGLQIAVSIVQRLRKPDVKRSSLRTGQRYPVFAHPTAGGASAGGSTNTSPVTGSDGESGATSDESSAANAARAEAGGDRPDGAQTPPGSVAAGTGGGEGTDAAGEESAEDEGVEDVGHTRVYSPPKDADEIEMADPDEAARRAGDGKYCPSCDEFFEGETRTFCSTCGARLEEP